MLVVQKSQHTFWMNVKVNGKNIANENFNNYPAGIYLLKVKNRNTRTRCEICSKLTIKLPERRQWRRSGIFIVNFEHVIAGWVKQWV